MAPEQEAATSSESFRAASPPEGPGRGGAGGQGHRAPVSTSRWQGRNLPKADIFPESHRELLSRAGGGCPCHPGPGCCSRFGLSCLHWLSGCLLEPRAKECGCPPGAWSVGPVLLTGSRRCLQHLLATTSCFCW